MSKIKKRAENYSKGIIEPHIKVIHFVAFKDGAEWQAERSYSRKDLMEAYKSGWDADKSLYNGIDSFKKWFKQYKNRQKTK